MHYVLRLSGFMGGPERWLVVRDAGAVTFDLSPVAEAPNEATALVIRDFYNGS